ncbi:unnamed protein product [Linum tenue]|uniref:PWWP domain-containing protein n=1 Tax=Linum tenue TaxID=586396 RepID=A0AAV0PMV0_9ROSI|nr:unnamed protein product [Linum tenue]
MSGDLDDIDLNTHGASAVPAKNASGALSAEPVVVSSGAETLADSVNGHGEGEKTVIEGVPEVKVGNELKLCEGEVESGNGGVDDSKTVKIEGVPEDVEAANELKDSEGRVESSNGGVEDSEVVVKRGGEGVLDVVGANESKGCEGKVESSDGGVDDSEAGLGPVKGNVEILDLGVQGGEEEPSEKVESNGSCQVKEEEEGATTDACAIQVQSDDSSHQVFGNEDAETPERQVPVGSSHNRVSEHGKTIKHLEDQKMEINDPKTESESRNVTSERVKTKPDNSDVAPSTVGTNMKGGLWRSKFADSDLVWGKVRSHPWWPAQIFDTSAASDQAKKYMKKERHLIVYFGDQSFAWNETSKIKPFRAHFSQMAKQSNSEEFHDAIDCALDEVARRVEFGLACPCVAEYNEIKTQVIVNPGIKDEYCRRDGGEICSSVASFRPEKLVQYIKGIGQSPLGGVDRLEFLTARSQVLALSRWKGYSQLPEFQILGTVLDEQVDVTLSAVEPTQGNDENEKKTSSSKRKRHSVDKEQTPAKKEKTLAALFAERRSNDKSKSSNIKSKSESKAVGKSSDGKKRKAADSGFDDLAVKKSQTLSSPEGSGKNTSQSKKGSFGIGFSILKVASEMNGSSPILKSHDDGPSSQRTKEEKKKQGSKKRPAKSKGKKSPTKSDSPATKILEEEGSDPILEEKSISECKNGEEVIAAAAELPATDEQGGNGTPEQQNGEEADADDADAVVKPPNEQVEEKSSDDDPSPTALILNFTDYESAPTVEELNKIFGRFGTLQESETQVLKKSSRARVVFCKRDDAETAFSSAGKYSTFGPSLVSYRLKYCSSPKKRPASSGRKCSSSGKK